MPEWKNLVWDQSTWGDGTSPQTNVLQDAFGGYMPWQDTQLQATERQVDIHVYALANPPDLSVLAEIYGVDSSSSLTKQIRDGVVEEQKLSLVISDPYWGEYYLAGAGKIFLQEFSYIRVEQHTKTDTAEVVVPIGLFRVSGLPQSSDDGSGVAPTWECEDWLASNLRTPFPDGENPYNTLINNFEGSVDINDLPGLVIPGVPLAPQGISPERLTLGNSIFGADSNWFHNFFGYIWNFMYDLTDGHFVVDRSVVQAAKKSSKVHVASPEVKGATALALGAGTGSGSGAQGPIAAAMADLGAGTPAQKFGIYSFPEGPSAISYLKDLISQTGLLSSHSGVKGTYFVYDREGELHWRRWGGIVNKEGLIFVCEGTARGNLSVPVERIQLTLKEPEYNHFIVQGNDIPFSHSDSAIPVAVLDPPDGSGLSIYGELLDGFKWTEVSTLAVTDALVPSIAIPPGGINHTFDFMEHYGGGWRTFNPAFTVAPTGSDIAGAFYGSTMSDPLASGAQPAYIVGTEVSRTSTGVTIHLENADATSTDTIYLTNAVIAGTVWAPQSLWTQPTQADFTDENKWNNAITFYDTIATQPLKTYEDVKLNTRWYTYPGLRDRTVYLYLGDDYVYIVTPVNIGDPPLDPRVANRELSTNAREIRENAIRYFGGPACEIQIGLDSAFPFTELGSSIRIQYPPQNIDGYFQIMSVNLPFSEQAQQWTLQWVEDVV